MLGNTAVSLVQYKLDHGRETSSIPGPKFFNFGLFLGLFNAENFSLVVNVSELFMGILKFLQKDFQSKGTGWL